MAPLVRRQITAIVTGALTAGIVIVIIGHAAGVF